MQRSGRNWYRTNVAWEIRRRRYHLIVAGLVLLLVVTSPATHRMLTLAAQDSSRQSGSTTESTPSTQSSPASQANTSKPVAPDGTAQTGAPLTSSRKPGEGTNPSDQKGITVRVQGEDGESGNAAGSPARPGDTERRCGRAEQTLPG